MSAETPNTAETASDLEGQMKSRRELVAQLRESGVNPYANGFVPTHTTAEVAAKSGQR